MDRESLPLKQPRGCAVKRIPLPGIGQFATLAQVPGRGVRISLFRFGLNGTDPIKELRFSRPTCFANSVVGEDSRCSPCVTPTPLIGRGLFKRSSLARTPCEARKGEMGVDYPRVFSRRGLRSANFGRSSFLPPKNRENAPLRKREPAFPAS